MIKNVDPRTKLASVICISTLALIFQNPLILMAVLFAGVFLAKIFGANLLMLIKRIRHILFLFIVIIFIQSLFVKTGTVLIGFENIRILTSEGLIRGIGYLMRILIILISGAILSTCDMRKLIQGLIQMKLPYDIAFMTSLGIKFLPLFVEEIKDTMIAIQLRGIDINQLSLRERLEIVSYLFTPIIAGTLNKSKKLSLSVECRGFRAYDRRTSITKLKMSSTDYLMISISILFSAGLIMIDKILV